MRTKIHDPENMTRMYKRCDFSHEAMRALALHKCPNNGEFGVVVWFGTKSERQAKKKQGKLAALIHDKNLKTFPKL